VGFLWASRGDFSEKLKLSEDIEEEKEIKKMANTLESIDENWSLYTNYNLGFSIEIPKEVYIGCDNRRTSKLKAFEEKSHVYIASEYTGEIGLKGCFKNDLIRLGQKPGITWKINHKEIANKAQLDDFIKANFGQGCSFDDGDVGEQDKTYSFQLGKKNMSSFNECMNDLDPDYDNLCCFNAHHVIEYNPVLKKAVTWSMGQDSSFLPAGYPVDKEALEIRMEKSFKFL
jgi:hypothetical protein